MSVLGHFVGRIDPGPTYGSRESTDFGTVPSGEVWKGPIREFNLEHEKGPE